MQQINFKDLKAKVGIDDVAYHLGYRLDRRAGVGRYIELVSEDGKDKLIIKNPRDKANQTFFRRNGSGGGDVVSFVRENLNSFHETGRNEWEGVMKVLAHFANEPLPDYADKTYVARSNNDGRPFDPNRYEVLSVVGREKEARSFLGPRGFNRDTIAFFAPHLSLIRDKQRDGNSYFNLGFPYTIGGAEKVVGYEMRGYGKFKSKAVGTNSTTGAWVVTKAVSPSDVRNVYFSESGYDIMAFYQANKFQLDTAASAFVSLGGTFSNGQVTSVLKTFNAARAFDCFDNDLPGRIAGLRMAALVEDVPIGIFPVGDKVKLVAGNKSKELLQDELSLNALRELVPLKGKIGVWKPAARFKDWNDQILNKPMVAVNEPNKFDRDRNLAERRAGGRSR